jgi:RNase P/RNase MRP subunit p30
LIDLFLIEKNFNASKMFSIAESLGIKKIILAKHFESIKELNDFKKFFKNSSISLMFCHLIENQKEIQRFKGKTDFLAVLGGDVSLNKFAVSNKLIDFLIQPINSLKLSFDTAIARTAFQNKKPIAFIFSVFLRFNGFQRMLLFKNHFLTVKLMKKFRVNALMFSGARKPEEIRSIKDLSSVLVLLGFSCDQAKRFSESFPENFFKVKKPNVVML